MKSEIDSSVLESNESHCTVTNFICEKNIRKSRKSNSSCNSPEIENCEKLI